MRYIVTINDKSYEVEVEKGQASVVKTTESAIVNTPIVSQAPTPEAVPVSASVATAPAAGPVISGGETVKAPMPGSILNVKVNNGQKVKKGDVLVILEAMKMENEITAPIEGVVVQILVGKGATVSTGDVLAVIQ